MHILEEAFALQKRCIEDRRNLHAMAETGFELKNSLDYIWKRLEEIGFRPQKCGQCGVCCTIGAPGRTILLRADMDALPIREESGLPFACKSGSMHACGHDMHAAMLISAAEILKHHEDELPGTVKLMFQPAEETLEGAKDMIKAGILENPHVDAAVMLHVLTAQPIPPGTAIASAPGVSAPSAGTFRLHIQGRGAHGAMSGSGVDPILAAAHIIIALQAIQTRELAMNDRSALTIGMVQAGNAANVIPDASVLRGSFRSDDDAVFEFMRKRIAEIVSNTAAVFRASAEITFEGSCPALVNDTAMCSLALSSLKQHLGADRIMDAANMPGRSSGSEDFASVSREVPSVMIALAAGRPEDGHVHPLHHPKATFDESALPYGIAAYAGMAMDYLAENVH